MTTTRTRRSSHRQPLRRKEVRRLLVSTNLNVRGFRNAAEQLRVAEFGQLELLSESIVVGRRDGRTRRHQRESRTVNRCALHRLQFGRGENDGSTTLIGFFHRNLSLFLLVRKNKNSIRNEVSAETPLHQRKSSKRVNSEAFEVWASATKPLKMTARGGISTMIR